MSNLRSAYLVLSRRDLVAVAAVEIDRLRSL